MPKFNVFLSAIIVTRNQAESLPATLAGFTETITALVSDYEIIVIDNASTDDTLAVLKNLTQADGLPNLQIFSLTSHLDNDIAAWIGMENSLGDFVLVINPQHDDIALLPRLLETATTQYDVVFAYNVQQPAQTLGYRIFYAFFKRFYNWLSGIDLSKEAPQYRLMSRRLINFMLQHSPSPINYRHLPASSGFAKTTLTYQFNRHHSANKKRLKDGIERGISLLISTSRIPMRMVSILCVGGAMANLFYSFYVIGIMIWKTNVAPGWATLSLQQSGMFFLLSLVLLILSEYILHIVSSPERLVYHVAQEFTSTVMKQRHKLNVETLACPTTTPL